MEIIVVQKNTIDEWEIAYNLVGNRESKNLVVMLHGGGMDHKEKGFFPGIKDGKFEKYIDESGKEKTKLYPMHIGNYDRLESELLMEYDDVMVLRIDLRNHGESKVKNKMDTRDVLIKREVYDVSDVIDNVINNNPSIENIHLVGTCFGGLIAESYATNIFRDESHPTINSSKISTLALNCPLSFTALYTNDEEDGFNYKKCQMIINGEEGTQFDKMTGVYEGKATMLEAKNMGDITKEIGNLNIPTLYIYGDNDRIISNKKSKEIAFKIASINELTTIKKIDKSNHGLSDHCLFDPQSSDAYIREMTEFLTSNINNKKDIYK